MIGGRYVLGGLLGSGGMGRVYRAYDENLGRDVALKVMEERHAEMPEFVERFEREAASAACLSHPNVVRVFDSGEDANGSPYIAMELVGGGTLKDRIRDGGPLPPREAATVALQVAEALEAAHEAGIIHRDVKPENVLLTEDGQAKVGDFGIAKATEATAMTHTSMILGTAPYLSPEQAKGEPVGPASDLYSLGVVLFEALTGRPPFGTGADVSPLAIALKHLNEPAPAARATNPDVPEPLEEITLALMRKDPAERHASAGVLADDLTAFLEDRGAPSKAVALVSASPEFAETGVLRRAPASTPRPRRGRRRAAAPVLAVTLAALFALAASPLAPPDGPLGFGTQLVSNETTSLNGSIFPELRQAPEAPEPPPEPKPQAPEPQQPEPQQPEPQQPEPQQPEPQQPEPQQPEPEQPEPEQPEQEPEPIQEAAPAPDAPSTAPASASASASATADATASASASAPAAEEPTPAAGEQSDPEPQPQSSPPPSSATPSSTAPSSTAPASEAAAPEAAAPEAPSSAAPSSAAPSSAPADAPADAPTPTAPAPGAQPPGVEPPDIEPLEIETPDF